MLAPVVGCIEKERVRLYALLGRGGCGRGTRSEVLEEEVVKTGLSYFDTGFGRLEMEVCGAVGDVVRDEIFADRVVGEDYAGCWICSRGQGAADLENFFRIFEPGFCVEFVGVAVKYCGFSQFYETERSGSVGKPEQGSSREETIWFVYPF